MADNLFTRFVAAVPDPGKAFLRPPGAPAISYGEAFARAAQFAHVLARHGLAPGDRVAVQAEKSPAALILYLACLRAGLVYLPLNTGYTAGRARLFRAGRHAQAVCRGREESRGDRRRGAAGRISHPQR